MSMQVLKISELTFDSTLYPRIKVGWLTAYQYAQAMRAGSIFPPIIVGIFKGKKYVVDGFHRCEALKIIKEEYVQAQVKPFKTFQEMFIESVKLNSMHGRPLSVQEKVRIIDKLEEMKLNIEEICNIVKVPIDKIQLFKARTIIGPDGKPVYLKSVVARAEAEKTDALNIDMDGLSVRSTTNLLKQLIELLESEVYPIADEDVKELTINVYSLLGNILNLVSVGKKV